MIFWVGLILMASIATWAFFDIRFQKQKALEQMVTGMERLVNTIRLGTHYAMMMNSRDDLTRITENVAKQKDIERVRIYNKEGRIKFSNLPEEVEKIRNIKAEACFICHKQEPPLDAVELRERVRVFDSGKDHRRLGLISPIYNEPGCAGGPCHLHPPDKKILGLLDVVVATEEMDKEMLAHQKRILGLAVVLFLASGTIIGLFLMRFLNRPIRKLITGTRHIGYGEFDYEVDESRNDEIGHLAKAFNLMRREIGEKQNALKQHWYEYQQLFEEAPCYITVQGRDLKIIRYNREFAERFSPERGDFCYKAYKGRSERCEICPVLKTLEDGEPHYSEEAATNKDGTQTYWMVKTSPIRNSKGEVIAAIEMSLDLTNLRTLEREVQRSEEKYRIIFNTIPNPLFVLSCDHLTILDCNQSVTAVYGFGKEDLVGTSFLSLMEGADRQGYLSMLKDKGSIDRVKQIRKDGTAIFVNIRIANSEYSGRKVFLVTTSNITARLLAEQQLIQASKMATLGEMATGMAHELNQPLSVIKTACGFLNRKAIRDEPIERDILRTMSQEIDSHVDRASKIINHMREFGRKSEVSKEKTQINQVLIKSLDFFQQQLKLREIEVVLDLGSNLPFIWADANRLEQVFINLLINARDAIERKWEEVRPEQETKRIILKTSMEEGMVSASITDNGTGIPGAILDKLFEPFFT
ncbi:MAG: PAS domain S-box protein, partial [Desulfobacterales bacterium]|nr:PAS domain S-box protein [Desulfobacterales bacterium]